jgi:hypothetical protein
VSGHEGGATVREGASEMAERFGVPERSLIGSTGEIK